MKWFSKNKKDNQIPLPADMTPLQAVTVYAAIANGGKMIKPNIVKNKNKKKNIRLISERTSESINKILRKVVTTDEGTAKLADIHGYHVGGKTGTSQVRAISIKEREEGL